MQAKDNNREEWVSVIKKAKILKSTVQSNSSNNLKAESVKLEQ
jgi:hypothetical protein